MWREEERQAEREGLNRQTECALRDCVCACIRQHLSACVNIRVDRKGLHRRTDRRSLKGLCVRVHCNSALDISQHTSAYVSICQHTSAYVSIRQQHTSAYVSTAAYVSIRQHTSAYVSMHILKFTQIYAQITCIWIQTNTSAYVSIRQHTSAYVSYTDTRK